MRALAAVVLLFACPALAAEYASLDEYQKQNRYKCPSPFDTLKSPVTQSLGGKQYKLSGYKLEVQNPDADAGTKIGVLSAIKDVQPGTKQNVKDALAWFKSQKVEWVVVNGDLALDELDLEEVMTQLGEGGLPTLLVIGNSESKSSWSRVMRELTAKFPNLVNGNWVRDIVADDVELWTLPGYYDKRFVHQGAGCNYGKDEIDAMLGTLKPAGPAPVLLVSHGPPQGSGKHALDYIKEKKNVGDPEMTRLLKTAGVPFGIFGHILEAGGQAVGKDLATPVAPNKTAKELYLNAGSLSGDPWGMNDGSTSSGMAFIVSIDGGQAKYELKKFSPPIPEE